MKKFFIDISTEEKRKRIYELFGTFKYKSEIFKYYGVSDNSSNCRYLDEIGNKIGFDFDILKKNRKKEKRFCLECGKELIQGQNKFCCRSCSAKYNNKKRNPLTHETKEKIRKALLKTKNTLESTKEKKNKEKIRKEKLIELSLKIKSNLIGKSKILSVDEETLREIVKYSITYKDVLRCLGYNEMGGAPWRNLKERLYFLGISTEHFKGKAHGTSPNRTYDDSEIYIENSEYLNRNSIKSRLLKDGIKENKCECCGITEWRNKPISLQLHHINGINNDNRIENLQLLCPNCHSQTDTYCGRNIYDKAKK